MEHNSDRGYEEAFSFVIGAEGGFGNDPRDRGNWDTGVINKGSLKGTKYGISAVAYPTLDIKNISLLEAKNIYFRDYWRPMYCDLLPYSKAICLFDCSVNQGKRRATKFAQIIGCTTQDSIMGMQTIGALTRMQDDLFVELYTKERERHYRSLKTFGTYGKGWLNRIDHVRKEAAYVRPT